MGEGTFSFRWGVELLDDGFVSVPNLFLDRYADVGVKPMEFLLIIHLARYHYERPGSECRPSLRTVAQQMDRCDRYLRQLLENLEKRGLLVRHYRRGKTTVYDFSPLSRKRNAAAQAEPGSAQDFTPEPDFQGTPEPRFRPPRNPSSAEQQQKEQKTNNNSAAGDPGLELQKTL